MILEKIYDNFFQYIIMFAFYARRKSIFYTLYQVPGNFYKIDFLIVFVACKTDVSTAPFLYLTLPYTTREGR